MAIKDSRKQEKYLRFMRMIVSFLMCIYEISCTCIRHRHDHLQKCDRVCTYTRGTNAFVALSVAAKMNDEARIEIN